MNDQNQTTLGLHKSTFQYLMPTEEQKADTQRLRDAAENYAKEIIGVVPNGADKTYILRKLREIAMWVNVAITRNTDGSPRS